MKISKQHLVEIIEEEFEKATAADVRKGAIGHGKAQVESGINDQERGVIQTIQKKLAIGAKNGNIASGKALRLIQLLAQELDNIAGSQKKNEPEEQQ